MQNTLKTNFNQVENFCFFIFFRKIINETFLTVFCISYQNQQYLWFWLSDNYQLY